MYGVKHALCSVAMVVYATRAAYCETAVAEGQLLWLFPSSRRDHCLWTWTERGHCEVMPGHSGDSGVFSLLEGESCKGCSPVESRT